MADSLDLLSFKMGNSEPGAQSGQPAYHPGLLVKLYLYGYLNGIRSSRKLEREAARNLELIRLTRGLKPADKTIANFRQDNCQALKEINKDVV